MKGFDKCCLSNAVDGTDDDTLRMAVRRMGMLEVSATKTNALTVKTETVTLIGNSRQNLTRFVY